MTPTKAEILLAEVEIRHLLVRERYYRDTAQWTKFRESWHPDASHTKIQVSWFSGNIDEFLAASQEMVKGGTLATHLIMPVDIHLSPCHQRAVSESTGNITFKFKVEEETYELVSWTRFISRLEKVGEDWKLAGLEAIYDRDSITVAMPSTHGDGAHGTSFKHVGRRESYSSLAWFLEQRGLPVSDDLAGTDRPQSVEELMVRQFDWLDK
ncbi:uncharacterized protein A1O9_10409 [Exophiala aquamarina CBS 119918]|uniref:SnoaL-like domain-containing protein n=1 Tax=Exophiala aquamarina CBS 119918 TaxID=1182545 RepID=A0A072NZZ8_9EURO|nr:uncharacterized protein A1O9_10409 [Exophiala aquamarina CBS 119918]KEF53434.1 hypothetical protein A1O9_10409 [Exophiala aquamarina CBS 119918]